MVRLRFSTPCLFVSNSTPSPYHPSITISDVICLSTYKNANETEPHPQFYVAMSSHVASGHVPLAAAARSAIATSFLAVGVYGRLAFTSDPMRVMMNPFTEYSQLPTPRHLEQLQKTAYSLMRQPSLIKTLRCARSTQFFFGLWHAKI